MGPELDPSHTGGIVVASARAHLPAGRAHRTRLRLRSMELCSDDAIDVASGVPSPVDLLASSVAASSAARLNEVLGGLGLKGDVDVHVEYDAMPPTGFHQHVQVACAVGEDVVARLREAVERSPVALLLRESLTMHTTIATLAGMRDGGGDGLAPA